MGSFYSEFGNRSLVRSGEGLWRNWSPVAEPSFAVAAANFCAHATESARGGVLHRIFRGLRNDGRRSTAEAKAAGVSTIQKTGCFGPSETTEEEGTKQELGGGGSLLLSA